ncbi:hypothetical protein CR513_39377, partial [Mucuna pruriens]
MWGVDILGPFPLAVGQVKFLLVVVDYFTKWVEIEPVATILAERVRRFYWRKIICHFGLPIVIVSNNGTQFTSWSSFTSVEHSQSNSQVKAINKLEEAKERWVEEIHRCFGPTIPHPTQLHKKLLFDLHLEH